MFPPAYLSVVANSHHREHRLGVVRVEFGRRITEPVTTDKLAPSATMAPPSGASSPVGRCPDLIYAVRSGTNDHD